MGGRGATMAGKHIAGKDMIFPGDKYGTGEPVDVDWDDPESNYDTELTEKLKERGFSTRASTDFADESRLARQQKQIARLSEQYENIYSASTSKEDIHFGTEDVRSVSGKPMRNIAGYCAFGYTEDGKIRQKIVLNNHQFERTAERQQMSIASGIREGQFVPIDLDKSREYVVTHEMGHALEISLIIRMCQEKGVPVEENMHRMARQIYKEVYRIAEKDGKLKERDVFLSSYAKQNDAEWFAETFTNLQLSDNPEPIAKALGEYLGRKEK